MKNLSLCFVTASSLLFPAIANADIPPRKRVVQVDKTKNPAKVESKDNDAKQESAEDSSGESTGKLPAPSGAAAAGTGAYTGTGAPAAAREAPAEKAPQPEFSEDAADESGTPEPAKKGCSMSPDAGSAGGLAFLIIAAAGLRRRRQ